MWGAFREAYDESVAVGHLHFRKRLRVDDLFRIDQLVLRKDVRSERVDLIVPASMIRRWPLPISGLMHPRCLRAERREHHSSSSPHPFHHHRDKQRSCPQRSGRPGRMFRCPRASPKRKNKRTGPVAMFRDKAFEPSPFQVRSRSDFLIPAQL